MTFLDIARTDRKHLDFKSFPFSHHITHDHINLGVIKEVIRDLPPFNISYTTDSQEIQADFEAILTDKSKLLDAETMTQNLMTTKSYIALSNVERHPLLKNLCDNIVKLKRTT